MSDHIFKIQSRFLFNVRNGFKKHEYRLYKGEKAKVKVGDYIRLVSNDNEDDYSRVVVNEVKHYKNWEEALREDWKADFAKIANTLDEAIDICKSFYLVGNVNKYGIVKYGIQCVDGINYKILRVKSINFSDVDLSSPFFDSLREDYDGFNNWFNKKQENHEKVYVLRSHQDIVAFLYLKLEDGEDLSVSPNFKNKKRLKIGTFKISKEAQGFRLGERFLKIAFDNALKFNAEEIYITLYEKREEVLALRNMLYEWGFVRWGAKGNAGEAVFVKSLKSYDSTKSPKFNYPLLANNFQMAFLPIFAKYHTRLFPDLVLKTEDNESFYGLKGSMYSLEKIYVSGVNPYRNGIKNGDLLVIYYIGEALPKHYSSVCSGLAVFVEAKTFSNLNSFVSECKNKTVFKTEELEQFFLTNRYKTVIKLIPYKTYTKKMPLYKLRDAGLIKYDSGPRSFDKIDQKFYEYFTKND